MEKKKNKSSEEAIEMVKRLSDEDNEVEGMFIIAEIEEDGSAKVTNALTNLPLATIQDIIGDFAKKANAIHDIECDCGNGIEVRAKGSRKSKSGISRGEVRGIAEKIGSLPLSLQKIFAKGIMEELSSHKGGTKEIDDALEELIDLNKKTDEGESDFISMIKKIRRDLD